MKFRWYIWIPRILIIIVALFAALFSLDVFQHKAGLGQILLGLFMHNIPSILLLSLLWVTWKRPIIGGIIFVIFAAIATVLIAIYFHKFFLYDFLFFIVPILIAALFFFLAHYNRVPPHKPDEEKPTDS